MKRTLALVCICIYMFTAQFVTKARATTTRENFAIDEDCSMHYAYAQTQCPHTSEKLDTFESKKNCRGKTYGELQKIPDLTTIKDGDIYFCIPNLSYIYDLRFYNNIYVYHNDIRPPPDDDDIYDLTHYRIGITEKRE